MIAHIRTFQATAGKVACTDYIRTCLIGSRMGAVSDADAAVMMILAVDGLHPEVHAPTEAERLAHPEGYAVVEELREAIEDWPEAAEHLRKARVWCAEQGVSHV